MRYFDPDFVTCVRREIAKAELEPICEIQSIRAQVMEFLVARESKHATISFELTEIRRLADFRPMVEQKVETIRRRLGARAA